MRLESKLPVFNRLTGLMNRGSTKQDKNDQNIFNHQRLLGSTSLCSLEIINVVIDSNMTADQVANHILTQFN